MKQIIKITMIAALALSSITTIAQSNSNKTGKGVRWSIGADAGLPVGKFNDQAQWNLGASVQADFNVASRVLFITANAGYMNHFKEAETSGDLSLIPVKAGLKYFPVKNLYIQGEAGVSFLANKDKANADKAVAFTYAPQIGYLIPLGKRNHLDAGIRYENNSKFFNNGSRTQFMALRLAYALDSK